MTRQWGLPLWLSAPTRTTKKAQLGVSFSRITSFCFSLLIPFLLAYDSVYYNIAFFMPPNPTKSTFAVAPNSECAIQKCQKDCKHTLPCGMSRSATYTSLANLCSSGHLICSDCLDKIISPRYARELGVGYTGVCADKECHMSFKSTIVRDLSLIHI